MAKGRKNGCPVNIKNWIVEIYDTAAAEFVRIYGLNSLTAGIDSETEDGSASTDVWAEPYVSKRSGSCTLEAKKVVEESTGNEDPGQALLNYYAEQAGCDADATLRFTDAYGHCWEADYIVTSREDSVDDAGDNYSWDLSMVGEADVKNYVHAVSVAMKDGSSTVGATMSMTAGGTAKIITVEFTPATSSNKRFKVTNTKRTVASVGNVTENGFTITPIAAGTTTITVTTVEGGKTTATTLTVSAGA